MTNPAPPAAGITRIGGYHAITAPAALTHSIPKFVTPVALGKVVLCFAAVDFAAGSTAQLTGVLDGGVTHPSTPPGASILWGRMDPSPTDLPPPGLGDSSAIAHTSVHAGVLYDWTTVGWDTLALMPAGGLATNPGQTFINTVGSGDSINVVAFAYHEAAAVAYNLAGIPNVTLIGQYGPDAAGVYLDLLQVDGNIGVTGIPFTPALVNHGMSLMVTLWPQAVEPPVDDTAPPQRLGSASCPCLEGAYDAQIAMGIQNPSVVP